MEKAPARKKVEIQSDFEWLRNIRPNIDKYQNFTVGGMVEK